MTELHLFRNEYNRQASELLKPNARTKNMLDSDELSGEEGGKMQRPKIRGTIYLDQSMCCAQNKLHSGAKKL